MSNALISSATILSGESKMPSTVTRGSWLGGLGPQRRGASGLRRLGQGPRRQVRATHAPAHRVPLGCHGERTVTFLTSAVQKTCKFWMLTVPTLFMSKKSYPSCIASYTRSLSFATINANWESHNYCVLWRSCTQCFVRSIL